MTSFAGMTGGLAGMLWVLSAAAAGSPTLDLASPMTRSELAADLARTPPRAVALKIDEIGSSAVWNAGTIRLRGMPMPDGDEATLVLRRMQNPIEATWLVRTDAAGSHTETAVAAAPVLLLSGSVDGEPDSAVFLGIYKDSVQGWIETDAGLHMIATPPDGGPTLMYRVGASRGGIDIPAPGRFKEVKRQPELPPPPTKFSPESDYDRLLMAMQDPESPLRELVSGEGARRLPDMLNRSAVALDPEVELGACCVMPGFCFQLPAALCADFCNDPDDTFCQQDWPDGTTVIDFDSTPPNLPPCWLGPGVPCDEQWVCFEPDPDANPGDPSFENWTGACCVQSPPGSSVYAVQDLAACECALLGGTFLVPPAICLGGDLASPETMATSNFVDAATILAIDPDICEQPSGACCFEQEVLCEDIADPDDPDFEIFEKVACINVPESICTDADIITESFNGTGEAGYFTKECFPCIFDPAGQGVWGTDFICPESMQKEPQGVGPPVNLVCQSPRITIDTDGWYLERFNGDVQAAQAYAAMLIASMNYILTRDALVELQVGDLLLRDDYQTYYVGGACCFPNEGWCMDSESEASCAEWANMGFTAQWQGPGSSCWNESGTPCSANGTVYEDADALWEISDTLELVAAEWGTDIPESLDGNNMILLLSGYPYGEPYFANVPWIGGDDWEDTWGVEVQDVAAGAYRTLCTEGQQPFAVASVKGTFPWPGETFDRDDVNWDIVAVARAVGSAIGVFETSLYGYDTCFGPPCEGVRASLDCDHRFFYADLFDLSSPFISTSSMPSTLMSFCHVCPGGSANVQLRFRSEMAARIYARFATMDCSWSGSGGLDPSTPGTPYAADDLFRMVPGGSQLLDVMANDVTPGCFDQNTFEPYDPITGDPWDPSTWDPDEDPWPIFPLDVTDLSVWENDPFDPGLPQDLWWDWVPDGDAALPGLTILGGTIDIVEDPANPNGSRVVEYTPPSESCGIDFFEYRITTDPSAYELPDGTPAPIPGIQPEEAEALVRIIEQPCSASYTIICNPAIPGDCPESVAEPPVPPSVPDPAAADVIEVVDSAAAEISAFAWSGLILEWDAVGSTLAEDAFLRVWVADAAGSAANTFFDVYPFGTVGVACGPASPYVPGPNPIAGPSSGSCGPPDRAFVPVDGVILVQCLEATDDLPGRDAWWTGGSFCVISEPTNAFGACCVDGLCIQTTAYDCAALGWNWDWLPPSLSDPEYRWGWSFDRNASGFFHGSGTSCCERDWCRRTAPCCYEGPNDKPACALLTCEECRDIGGVMLTMSAESHGTDYCDPAEPWFPTIGPPQPLWDTECVYPVCNFEDLSTTPLVPISPPDPSGTVGACCVTTLGGERFCADLTRDDCEAYEPDPLIASTSWSVVARCDEVPCGPLGACCVDSGAGLVCIADGWSEVECESLWYVDPANPPDLIVFREGETCGANSCNPSGTGACCLTDVDVCCDGFTKDVCDLVYGTYLGDGVLCTACDSTAATGVCSLAVSGLPVCTSDLTQNVCENTLGGTWYPEIVTCSEGVPDLGRDIVPADQPETQPDPANPLGACCHEYECVPQVHRFDCILAGGRFLSDDENPYGTHANPGGCPPTQDPWIGRCCMQTTEFGPVCVKLTSAECVAEGGTFALGVDCPSLCGVVELDLCAPGECEVIVPVSSGIGGTSSTITYVAADEARCLSRDGRWLGYKSELGYTSAQCPPTQTFPLTGGSRREGDLTGDGRVGADDLLQLFANWGSDASRADLDGSGKVGVDDLIRLLSHWD